MPQETRSIFSQAATDRLRSPDDLDKYVRVTNPSVWAILVACIALVAGLLAWGVFGSVTTSISTTGAAVDGKPLCFLSAQEVAKVNEGDIANVDGSGMTVSHVATVPLSRAEVADVLKSDYLVSALAHEDWVYEVDFSGDASGLADKVPVSVNITVQRTAPIMLVLGEHAG